MADNRTSGLGLLSGLVAGLLAIMIAAFPVCAEPSHGLAETIARNQKPRLNRLRAAELSELILDLMPLKGGSDFSWDPALTSPVIWLGKEPRRNLEGDIIRQAIGRIHLQGSAPIALHRRRQEIGWTIKLVTDQAREAGPRWIEITPGIPGRGCFGSFYSGCLFSPPQIFASAPLSPKMLCRTGDASSFNQVYRVSSAGRSDVLVIYSYTNASDDEVSWIEIHKPSSLKLFCIAPNK